MNDYSVLDNNLSSGSLGGLSENSINFLRETAKWGKFSAIVGFVFIGILVIIAFVAGPMLSSLLSQNQELASLGLMGSGLITGIYLFFAAFWFFPTYYLYHFSVKTKKGIDNHNSHDLDDGLKNLKSMFKYWGVVIAIMLAFYLLSFIRGLFA